MDYISSCFLVNFRTGWVLGSTGMFPLSQVRNSEALYELAERNKGALDKNYWLYNEATSIERVKNYEYNVTREGKGLSLVMTFSSLISDPGSVFIANIDMNTWKRWIGQVLGDCEELVVLDASGGGNLRHGGQPGGGLQADAGEWECGGEEPQGQARGDRLHGILQTVGCPGLGILHLP